MDHELVRLAHNPHAEGEIAQTEVFGPVLTILRYEGDDDEAVRIANASPTGWAHSSKARIPSG
jgi:aldehyde dehydrogenase (NAD+)